METTKKRWPGALLINYVLVNCDNYCVQANIGPHKFIAFSNNDIQRETVLLNDLKTTTLKHTVVFTASTTDTATVTLVLVVPLHSYCSYYYHTNG
ncbi:hypothetical protein T09_3477 [Trichinella sp. T9]|nr:hypothetical protein T09_3477 [Trichinella sp. T9]